MRIIELGDLHIFRTVAQEGGVIRAAGRLNRVPSNVTTRIKQFEERLGVQLFRRQGRSIVLTDAGQALLGHADRLLRMAEEVEQEICSGSSRGVLRLGSLESAASVKLPPILSQYHARYPQTTIELQTGTTAGLLRLLGHYDIEAAFVSEPFDQGGMSSIAVFEEELVLITARGAPPIRKASELANQTVVAFPHGCSYRRRFIEWLAEDGVSPERFLDLGSYHAIVACVAAGSGIAIVPAGVLDNATVGQFVDRHPLPARLRTNRTHLVWTGEASSKLRTLIDMLPAVCQEVPRKRKSVAAE